MKAPAGAPQALQLQLEELMPMDTEEMQTRLPLEHSQCQEPTSKGETLVPLKVMATRP